MAVEMCLLAISLNVYGKRKLKITENGGKIMEPADIMKMTMTVEEAKAQIDQLPEDDRRRFLGENFSAVLLAYNLTPTQIQAQLVLAWNKVLNTSRLSYPNQTDC